MVKITDEFHKLSLKEYHTNYLARRLDDLRQQIVNEDYTGLENLEISVTWDYNDIGARDTW